MPDIAPVGEAGKRSRLKQITCAMVFVGGLYWIGPIEAQLYGASWWEFIHCYGSGVDHTDGSSVDSPEYFVDSNFSYNQCHGVVGEATGHCRDPGPTDQWGVRCSSLIGGQNCIAYARCPDGTNLQCVSRNGSAFAGIQTEIAFGSSRSFAFVHCDGQGSQDNRCEL